MWSPGLPGSTTSLGAHSLRDVPGLVALHQLAAPALRSDFPPPSTLDTHAVDAPPQRSTFVGRRREIDAVRRLLLDPPPGDAHRDRAGRARRAWPSRSPGGRGPPPGRHLLRRSGRRSTTASTSPRPWPALPGPSRRRAGARRPARRGAGRPRTPSWCSTTASTSSTQRPSWPTACSTAARRSACWPRAESRSTCPASRSTSSNRSTPGVPTPALLFLERATALGGSTIDLTGATIDELCCPGRRHPAGHRAGRGPHPGPDAHPDRGAARRALRRAGRQPARHPRAPADAAGHDRLELRPARPRTSSGSSTSSRCSPGASTCEAAASLAGHDPVGDGRAPRQPGGQVDGRRRAATPRAGSASGCSSRCRPTPTNGSGPARRCDRGGRPRTRLALPDPSWRCCRCAAMARETAPGCAPDLENIRLAFARAGAGSPIRCSWRRFASGSSPADEPRPDRRGPTPRRAAARGRRPRRVRPREAARGPVVHGCHRGRLERLRGDRAPGAGASRTRRRRLVRRRRAHLDPRCRCSSRPTSCRCWIEQRYRLDGLDGAGAEVDRATIDFYLAGALLNLRRFDEGTDVFHDRRRPWRRSNPRA